MKGDGVLVMEGWKQHLGKVRIQKKQWPLELNGAGIYSCVLFIQISHIVGLNLYSGNSKARISTKHWGLPSQDARPTPATNHKISNATGKR